MYVCNMMEFKYKSRCLHKLKPENHIQQGLLITNTYKHSLNSSVTSIITFTASLYPESGTEKFIKSNY